jgi:hypothetical protein
MLDTLRVCQVKITVPTLHGFSGQGVNGMRLSNQLSKDPIDREGMSVDAGGRLRQGQAPTPLDSGARTWLRDEEAAGPSRAQSSPCSLTSGPAVPGLSAVCLGQEYLGWWHAC